MAGKVCTAKQGVSQQRARSRHNFLPTPTPQCNGSTFRTSLKSRRAFHENDRPLMISLQPSKRCLTSISRQRAGTVKCESCLSPNPFCSARSRCELFLNSQNVRINRIRAHYKSEDDEMKNAKVELGASGEAVLVEGASSSGQQFPKRWVIVILCFAAFLLCNMDRVSDSLALSAIRLFSLTAVCLFISNGFKFSSWFLVGKHEYCNTPDVQGIQLEQCNGWTDSVLIFLGLSTYPGISLDTCSLLISLELCLTC